MWADYAFERAEFYSDFRYHERMIWAVQGDVKGLGRLNTKY
jgi:hypothetical protein